MDQELKRQLEEIHALARDNHRLIRAVRRHQMFGIVMTILFWLVIAIAPFYLYQQYLQPLVEKFSAAPAQTTSGLFGLPTSADVQKLFDLYKNK